MKLTKFGRDILKCLMVLFKDLPPNAMIRVSPTEMMNIKQIKFLLNHNQYSEIRKSIHTHIVKTHTDNLDKIIDYELKPLYTPTNFPGASMHYMTNEELEEEEDD